MKRLGRFIRSLRFSMASLVLAMFTIGSVPLLVVNWSPWKLTLEIGEQSTGSSGVSPDGRVLAIPQASGMRCMDLDTGRRLFDLPHSSKLVSADFSHDGRALLGGTEDGAVVVWDRSKGSFALRTVLTGAEGEIQQAAMSDDGQRLAAYYRRGKGPELQHEIKVWNIGSGTICANWCEKDWVGEIGWAGEDLLIGHWDSPLLRIRITDGRVVASTPLPVSRWVRANDGTLLGAGANGATRIDTSNGTLKQTCIPFVSKKSLCGISHDGNWVIFYGGYKCAPLCIMADIDGGIVCDNLEPCARFTAGGRRIVAESGHGPWYFIYDRNRPAGWWGIACLPAFWFCVISTGALWMSLRRDWRSIRPT